MNFETQLSTQKISRYRVFLTMPTVSYNNDGDDLSAINSNFQLAVFKKKKNNIYVYL